MFTTLLLKVNAESLELDGKLKLIWKSRRWKDLASFEQRRGLESHVLQKQPSLTFCF